MDGWRGGGGGVGVDSIDVTLQSSSLCHLCLNADVFDILIYIYMRLYT